MRKQKLQNLESDKHSAKHFFTDKQNMLNIVLLKSSQIKMTNSRLLRFILTQ